MTVNQGDFPVDDGIADGGRLLSPSPLLDLPYGYSRDHGILLRSMDGERASIAMRAGADPSALLEVRRYLALPFDVELVDGPAFERLLSDHYAMDGSAAAMAGDMALAGEGLDDIAGDIPSAEDLLDSADDAPTIR
ncbi:MAG: type II secretion system protein GspE, partial [Parasphingorhabdus sp.]|nr:type II secretion system protein GspE [Parasphingorhabdus sp.]